MLRPKLWTQLLFLAATFTVASGYRWRCYWFCTDQTGIQNDYIEQRDECRNYAQLKYSAIIEGSDSAGGESRDTALVRLFAECMAQHGWQVPGLGDAQTAAAAPMAPTTPMRTTTETTKTTTTTTTAAAAPVAASATDNGANNKAALTRHAECEFARESAPVSHIAAERAQACDEECRNALKANPTGPLPAACPSNYSRPAATASKTTTSATKTIVAAAPPLKEKPQPKRVIHHAAVNPKPVTVYANAKPSPKPRTPPKPVSPPPPSPVYPPSPVPVVTPPAPPTPARNVSEASLLSGLLGADLMLFFILLALYLALRLASRRRKANTPPRHEPSLSAKMRGRSENR